MEVLSDKTQGSDNGQDLENNAKKGHVTDPYLYESEIQCDFIDGDYQEPPQ